MTRLITEWSTDDPKVAESLRMISELPEFSAERLEAEAGLHMLQARWAWSTADQIRAGQRDREARKARRGS